MIIKTNDQVCQAPSRPSWLEVGFLIVLVIILGKILAALGLFGTNAVMGSTVSFGAAFMIGLVAASSSCVAVTGGLLLSVASSYAKAHNPQTRWEKFKPHLYFNAGRIASYTILGGAIGALGKAIGISPTTTGILTMVAAILMIATGMNILQRGPRWLRNLQPRPPKFLAHKILDASGKERPFVPSLMGAVTFFLPCGFTQALQLYVLGTGSSGTGALVMLAFSLGTLPSLLALGAATTYAKGNFGRRLLKFSGALVLVMGVYNFNNSFTVMGLPTPGNFLALNSSAKQQYESTGTYWDGQYQVAQMEVVYGGYNPAKFVVQEGLPVKWQIAGEAVEGCLSVIQIPKFGVRQRLVPGDNEIVFTPTSAGEAVFSCSMGMFRGKFVVLPKS